MPQVPYNKNGLEEIVAMRNVYFRVLRDRSRLGFLYQKLYTPGETVTQATIQIGRPPSVPWAVLMLRHDLPKGTVAFCPDQGAYGSYWRHVGISLNFPLGWRCDAPYMLADYKGSRASPIASFANVQNGFKDFGRPAVLPPYFWNRGCELLITGTVIRTSGTQPQQTTAVQVNGVTVFSAPWAVPTMREQRLDLRIWVNNTDTAANPNVLTSTGNVAPGGYVTGTDPATNDYAVTGLSTLATTIAIGITDTADGNPGTYTLGKFAVQRVS